MGRWLSKEDYSIRAKRIVELREKDELEFADIARRMGILQGVVEYSYRKSKREECHICGKKAIHKSLDPFFEELPELLEGGENKEEWWCDDCYQERLDDI